MKKCSKYETEYPARTEYFYLDKRAKDGLGSQCKQCHGECGKKYRDTHKNEVVEHNRKYHTIHRVERVGRDNEHRKTIPYRITKILSGIKQRCYNHNCDCYKHYGGRGITLEFTRKELEDWLSENNIDPRGLDIHRKDNDGNYTLDNIEFLTHSEHTTLHKRCHCGS